MPVFFKIVAAEVARLISLPCSNAPCKRFERYLASCRVWWFASLFSMIFCTTSGAAKVDFNRDIRPIMADTCFRCHGFDAKARKARLRLDVREEATQPAKSGAVPIVPGRPQTSEVMRRLFAEDEEERMPPAELRKPLTTAQKELFRRWIAEGAEYQDHWSFVPPASSGPPTVKPSRWPRTPVDYFILARLEEKKMNPSREAD